MAFSAREVRLILSIQSYGTGNIARLRTDLMRLNDASRTANAAQSAVQKQILRDQEKYTRLQDRINAAEARAVEKRLSILGKADAAQARFAQKRQKVLQRESALSDALLAKQLQIKRSQDRHAAMGGTGMGKFAVRQAALDTQRLRINKQIALLPAQEAAMQARVWSNKARILSAEQRLVKLKGSGVDLDKMATGNLGNYGRKTKIAAYQLRAALAAEEAITIEQKEMVRNAEIYNSQLAGIARQEELIGMGMNEQAAAMARQIEQTGIYESQLARIEADQAQIAAQIAEIDKEEVLVNAKLAEQLRLLGLENVELNRQKVQLTEIGAIVERNQSKHLADAAILDATNSKLRRLQKTETMFRGAAHVGRTAQFGGLIGLAGFAGAGNAFANFNKQAVLAASQARQINAPLSDIPVLADAITHGIHGAGVEIKGIMDLMQQFPATGDEMAAAAYDIFSSMDVSFGGGMKLLEKFNQLAVATGSDLETSTNAGITVLNNFGKASGGINEKLNLMVTIIRFGRMRLEDLNAMFEKVAPAATAAGQSLQDVAGAMVAVTRLQPSQRVGATGIARLLQTFRDPDFQKGANRFGLDITKGAGAVGKLKPLPEIIGAFAKNVGLFQEHGGPGALFKDITALGHGSGIGRQSRIEAQNAFTFLVGHFREYRALQKAATGDAKEFEIALKAMSDAPGVKWQIFINQMRALILTIGEAALPALLSLASVLQRAAAWFDGLSDGMKTTIVRTGVFAAGIMLFVGTIGNMIASLGAAVVSLMAFRVASQAAALSAEEAAVKASYLVASMNILAGIGLIAIPIIIQLIRGGDPGLWTFLTGALSGAAGGALIGAGIGSIVPGVGTAIGAGVGALAGGLVVPISIELISKLQGGKGPKDRAEKEYAIYQKAWRDSFSAGGRPSAMLSFDDWLQKHPGMLKAHNTFLQKHTDKDQTIMQKYLNYKKKFDKEFVQGELDKAKQIAASFDQQGNKQSQAQKRQEQLQKLHVNAMQAGRKAEEAQLKTGVDKMIEIYEKIQDANKAAFGELGQGPMVKGIFGSIFTGLNDMLRQFGVVIPLPFDLVRRDFEMQMQFFKRWVADLAKLRKMGLPEPLVQQIEAMGPDQGMAYAEGLAQGGKQGINQFKKMWNEGQKQIDAQTKTDMDAQLRYWKTFGNDAAYQMIMGLIDSPHNAGLRKRFRSYLKNNFASQLKGVFKTAFSEAMKSGMEDLNAQAAAEKAAQAAANTANKTGGKPGGGGGKPHFTFTEQWQAANRAAKQAGIKAKNRRDIALAMGHAAVQTMSPGGTHITKSEDDAILAVQQQALHWAAVQHKAMIRARHFRRIHQRTVRNVRGQMQNQLQSDSDRKNFGIVYHGDTYNVKVEGMTPETVAKGLERHKFRKRKKKHRGGNG